MERENKELIVSRLVRWLRSGKLDLCPDFQRGPVWGKSQKRLFVDSIMKDMDIPKIYLRKIPKGTRGKVEYEVVDGQQRLQTLVDFCDGNFKTESTEIGGKKLPSMTYSTMEEHDDDLREQFDGYGFAAIIIRDAEDDEVEDMFLRLQNGSPLNAPEKRNAMPGNMRDFVRELSKHDFFCNCGFKDKRYAFAHVASQMVCLEMDNGMGSIRKPELDRMYKNNRDFDVHSQCAKNVKAVLGVLHKAFPRTAPELEKHNAISMFLLFRHLRRNFVVSGRESEIGEWFVRFEQNRKEDNKRPSDEREVEMIEYQDKTGNSTDSPDSLEYRQKVLRVRLFGAIPDLEPLDEPRNFTDEQRRAIWRRDRGVCQIAQKCKGVKLEWDDPWHSDHKTPWSQGGKTTVENGQVACADCNLAKGNTLGGNRKRGAE